MPDKDIYIVSRAQRLQAGELCIVVCAQLDCQLNNAFACQAPSQHQGFAFKAQVSNGVLCRKASDTRIIDGVLPLHACAARIVHVAPRLLHSGNARRATSFYASPLCKVNRETHLHAEKICIVNCAGCSRASTPVHDSDSDINFQLCWEVAGQRVNAARIASCAPLLPAGAIWGVNCARSRMPACQFKLDCQLYHTSAFLPASSNFLVTRLTLFHASTGAICIVNPAPLLHAIDCNIASKRKAVNIKSIGQQKKGGKSKPSRKAAKRAC